MTVLDTESDEYCPHYLIMRFQPTAEELTVGIVHGEGPYNLDLEELAVSGSGESTT
jgi:hypothetical protein